MAWWGKYGNVPEPDDTFLNNTYVQWVVDGKYHRDNGPARMWEDGSEEWYQHGNLHRGDGPAFINNIDISSNVIIWIKENNYPIWVNENSWDDAIKIHFKLTFVG